VLPGQLDERGRGADVPMTAAQVGDSAEPGEMVAAAPHRIPVHEEEDRERERDREWARPASSISPCHASLLGATVRLCPMRWRDRVSPIVAHAGTGRISMTPWRPLSRQCILWRDRVKLSHQCGWCDQKGHIW
jgi:hypothetical protein